MADSGQKTHSSLWYYIMAPKKKMLHSIIYQIKAIHYGKKMEYHG